MSLLNELDERIAAIEDRESRRDSELEEQARFYSEELRPVMLEALVYFSDLGKVEAARNLIRKR